MALVDYERQLYQWLVDRTYAELAAGDSNWLIDKRVRDTGPFIDGASYGVHPAVRIYYSPKVAKWLKNKRSGAIEDGGMIIKEMFVPPAAIYNELASIDSGSYEAVLPSLVTGWAVMIRDSKVSKDGWFWSSPFVAGATFLGNDPTTSETVTANLDDYSHLRNSGFGLYTCMRCHSSAEEAFTFSSTDNIEGFPGEPIQYHVDNSWRNAAYTRGILSKVLPGLSKDSQAELKNRFNVPAEQLPYDAKVYQFLMRHGPPPPSDPAATGQPLMVPNRDFLSTFGQFTAPDGKTKLHFAPVVASNVRSIPFQWSDHVIPGYGGPGATNTDSSEFITSDTCVGCHGGLGGSPYPVTMFVKTGPAYGDGFDVAPYGEWRWSPMGLAGRDPIFHAQLESEMIILAKNANSLTFPGSVVDRRDSLDQRFGLAMTQKALANTCLSCHGAMGQRQLQIDENANRKLPNGNPLNGDFNPDYFYLTKALTSFNPVSPPDAPHDTPNPRYTYINSDDYPSYYRYGELAREGISCTVCHRATEADSRTIQVWKDSLQAHRPTWLPANDGAKQPDSLLYFLAENTTGRFERSPADAINGPFEDVIQYPMRNALGISPRYDRFTSSSEMCGACHTINLPNIGAYPSEFKKPAADPVLKSIENNPTFQSYPHSIEQATYLEWLNSDFGTGAYDAKTESFRTCQDCHMPGGLELSRLGINIPQLTTKISTIQDVGYPETTNIAPAESLTVRHRDDYRRHEHAGLNVFLIEMASQFPHVLGIDKTDYMTSATTGATLAAENMLRLAREATVALAIKEDGLGFDPKTNTLTADVLVTNLTGHRFPSGVAFRRAFLEFLVLENNEVVWGSGRTNAVGLIVDGDGNPLPTEFLDSAGPDGRSNVRAGNYFVNYQPHYQVITAENQVQIYEELILDANRNFTTSFIHRLIHVKDNRLLPKGYLPSKIFARPNGQYQGQIVEEFIRATDPEGPSVVGDSALIGPLPIQNGALANGIYAPDASYIDESIGTDSLRFVVKLPDGADASNLEVRVTMYSQSLSPAWLHQRFKLAAEAKAAGLKTPETDRLYYISSHLDLRGTAIDNWKLPLVTSTATVKVTD